MKTKKQMLAAIQDLKATNFSLATPDWNNTFIRIFYISTLETLDADPFSIVEEE